MKIEINLDGAAFTPEDESPVRASGKEAARILTRFADSIEDMDLDAGSISFPNDFNGNRVGTAVVTGRRGE